MKTRNEPLRENFRTYGLYFELLITGISGQKIDISFKLSPKETNSV